MPKKRAIAAGLTAALGLSLLGAGVAAAAPSPKPTKHDAATYERSSKDLRSERQSRYLSRHDLSRSDRGSRPENANHRDR
jgi:hypothetical protein